MSTKQLEQWSGEFGTAYTDRNAVDWRSRVAPFQRMIGGLPLRSILEVGCNRGHNLLALRELFGEGTEVVGVEPNAHALHVARQSGGDVAALRGNIFDLPFKDGAFDLVFTCGVLIHVAPDDLPAAMREVARVAGRYILAVEYYAPEDTEIDYRGRSDLLWKGDFLGHYRETVPGVTVLDSGYWEAGSAINDANWWLLEKPATPTA